MEELTIKQDIEQFPLVKIRVNCPLCSSKNNYPIAFGQNSFDFKDRPLLAPFDKTWIQLLKCKDCGFAFTKEIPYARDFFSQRYDICFNPEVEHKDQFKNHIHETIFYNLKKYKKEDGHFLDIGCFSGILLCKARDRGFFVSGIVLNPTMEKYCVDVLKLDVLSESIDLISSKENFYDVITLIDVLEHLQGPKEVLKKCFNALSKSGILVIKVPNLYPQIIKQSLARFLKISSKGIFENFGHLNHFSPVSLKNVLQDLGFEILHIAPAESEFFEESNVYNKVRNMFRKLYFFVVMSIYKFFGINIGFNLVAYVRKS